MQIIPATSLEQLVEGVRAAGYLSDDLIKKVEAVPSEGYMTASRSSAADVIDGIAQELSSYKISDGIIQGVWERIGLLYKFTNRFTEALEIFRRLYDQILIAQEKDGLRYPKGMPLVWMSDCYQGMGFHVTAQRYLMLTLIEDAINGSGAITFGTGAYPRLVWSGLLTEPELQRYAREAYGVYQDNQQEALYPEWVLQHLDRDWITQIPAPHEGGVFASNPRYVRHMTNRLGDKSGKALEELADYLLSCMPGCRTAMRKRSFSTDYDVVCSVEGLETDFRSELGRYFVCECKDLVDPADVTAFAKFCYVLDSVKSRFGILFSTCGISGSDKREYARNEQVKVFQNRGIVIVVVDEQDLNLLSEGANFTSLLRKKYEEVRLDFRPSAAGCSTTKLT